MNVQQTCSRSELITMLMQKRIDDIDIEKAYELVDMAVRGEYPDEGFGIEECETWSYYRFLIWTINRNKSEERAP